MFLNNVKALLWWCIDILRIRNLTHAGLGMYGDSEDSDSGDDATGNNSPSRINGADSDEELRVRGC
jgi:hypothetical protein